MEALVGDVPGHLLHGVEDRHAVGVHQLRPACPGARAQQCGRDPIGKHIKDLYPGSKSEYEIVGVARDFRTDSLRGKVVRHFYAPAANAIGGGVPPAVGFEVRTVPSASVPSTENT